MEDFWTAVWDDCGVIAETRGERVLADGDKMPGARFFPDARLNFAENHLRRRDDTPALIFRSEDKVERSMSWAELYDNVSRLAQALKAAGIGPGDRCAGFVPNMPETIVATLAVASLGAVWTSCSPDFGVQGVLDRFGQVEPKLLFCADGYNYNGKSHDSLGRVTGNPGRPADRRKCRGVFAAGGRTGCFRRAQRPPAGRFHRAVRGRRDRLRADALQYAALYPLFVGHDRRSEMHPAWRRRHPAAAYEGTQAAQRREAGRPGVLFHHLRLDDVELAGRRADAGSDAAALRWLALPSRRQCAVRFRRRPRHDAVRHLGEIYRRPVEGGAETDGQPRPVDRAHHGLHRLAAGAGKLRLRLFEHQEGYLPVVDFRRHRHRVLLHAGQPGRAGLARRDPGGGAGHGGRGVRR